MPDPRHPDDDSLSIRGLGLGEAVALDERPISRHLALAPLDRPHDRHCVISSPPETTIDSPVT